MNRSTLTARVKDDGIPSGARQTRAPARGAASAARGKRSGRLGARTPELQAALANRSGNAERAVAVVDRVPRRPARHVRSRAAEDVAGHTDVRELPMVASVRHAAGPPDGTWVVLRIFDEPGTYLLRAIASDGALFAGEDVSVSVSR